MTPAPETLASARRYVEQHAVITPLPGSGRWRVWLRAGQATGRYYGRTRAEAIEAAAARIMRDVPREPEW